VSVTELTREEQNDLKLIFQDLQLIFSKDEIPAEEIEGFIDELSSAEAKSYIHYLKEGKPEAALSSAFFGGRSILKKYLFGDATPEAITGDGFIDYKVTTARDEIILVELKPLFEPRTEKVKAGREIRSLKRTELVPEKHKEQVLKYVRKGGEYVILTNLKDWIFFNRSVTVIDFKPFASTDLMKFHEEFEVERDLWDYLTRLDDRSIREDLDKQFFKSLEIWVNKLSEVDLTVDEKRKTELIINLINRFVFIQTLHDYRVIEPRWIRETWAQKERRWASKGKERVLKEFFGEIDSFFFDYYDTELFRERFLDHIKNDEKNVDLLHRNLRLVLGLEHWMSALGGFRGIIQYNFRQIDEDIFGKAYETFLVEIRKETGVYYTPAYVSLYVVSHTVIRKWDKFIRDILESVKHDSFEQAHQIVSQMVNFKVLDLACGSGSFLIKALRIIWRKYKHLEKELDKFLREWEKNYQGTLAIPHEIEQRYEKLTRLKELLGLGDDRQLISKIILRHIHGNDFDRRAIEVAKVNIWLEAMKLAPGEFNYRRLTNVKHILPDLEANLVCGDSLVCLSLEDTLEILSTEYKAEIAELSKLRKQYLEDPTEPSIIENIQAIKSKIKTSLKDKLLEVLNEGERKLYDDVTPTFWPLECWHAFFNDKGALISQNQIGFDAVIGNPPYYVEVREHSKDFQIYRASPLVSKYYEAKMDVFYFFIELGLDLLKLGGNLGFIIMEYWYSRSHAKILREKIAHNSQLYDLIHFNEFKVFEEAKGQHNDVILLERDIIEKPQPAEVYVIDVLDPSVSVAQVHNALLKEEFIEDKIVKRKRILRYDQEQRKIHLRDPSVEILTQKINEKQNFKLRSENISQGLVIAIDKITGGVLKSLSKEEGEEAIRKYGFRERQGVFVISPSELSSMALNRFEKELIRPYYEAERITPYFINMDNHDYIIYTGKTYIDFDERDVYYEARRRLKELEVSNDEKKRVFERLKGEVREEIQEKARIKYPTITRHLDKFQKVITSDRWPYGLHRSREEKFFTSSGKIVGVRKTYFPKFVWVEKPCYIAETVNYILPDEGIDPICLTTILNSTLMWFWFKFGAEKTHGEQLQIDIEVLETMPIRIPENKIRKELIENGKRIGILRKMENKYIDLWNKWSTKLKNGEISLWDILTEDRDNLRAGKREKTWTKEVSFYPGSSLTEDENRLLDEEFNELTLLSVEEGLVIFGIKDGKKELFSITFEDQILMEHVILSIHSTLESQVKVKSLRDLFTKTNLPIVKPNKLNNTPHILETVHKEFKEYIQSEGIINLNIPTNTIDIWKDKEDTKAEIDAKIFQEYDFSSRQAKEVMDLLSVPLSYQQKVLDFLT
jgi:hypothetical protein